MCPMGVIEPFWSKAYEPNLWGKLTSLIRDGVVQVLKMPWYIVGMSQVAPMKVDKKNDGSKHVGMLLVVNAHDVVPNTPLTLFFPGFIYVHSGHELLLNSYLIHYFKATIMGATLGARHNLEMHLHMLDPTRDKPLVNKSDDLLYKDCKMPACWWDPVPHKGMTRNSDGKWIRLK